jgi:Protein kinase domain
MVQQVTCACPGCQRRIAVPQAFTPGNRLGCPHCQHSFVWPSNQSPESSEHKPGASQGGFSADLPHAMTTNSTEATASLPRIGRFKIRRVLGEGGFGIVYEAFDPQLGRIVALKVARLDGDSKQRTEDFLRQAESAAKLRHTHIVPLLDFGHEGDQFYLVLAYIRGQSLDRLLNDLNANNKTMKPAQAARVALHLAEALGYAHGQGIVHRDVNPHNVMLDENGDPLLMDFGLASHPATDPATRDGDTAGSAKYMAPEAVNGQWMAASDQYSLGVTMYELLTGETPFQGPPDAQMNRRVNTEAKAPSSRNPRVPTDMDTICLKCLEKNPTNRYPDCKALAEDLRRFQKGLSIAGWRRSSLSPNGTWPPLNLGKAILCLLVIGVTCALAYSFFTGSFGNWADQLTAGIRFDDAMSRGVKAEKRKEFGVAVEAFGAALKIRPNDIDALTAKRRAEEAWRKEQKELEDWRKEGGDDWPVLAFPLK